MKLLMADNSMVRFVSFVDGAIHKKKGRYHCELPSAADPNVTLILYANICKLHTISWLYYNTQTNNYFCTLTLYNQWILGVEQSTQ